MFYGLKIEDFNDFESFFCLFLPFASNFFLIHWIFFYNSARIWLKIHVNSKIWNLRESQNKIDIQYWIFNREKYSINLKFPIIFKTFVIQFYSGLNFSRFSFPLLFFFLTAHKIVMIIVAKSIKIFERDDVNEEIIFGLFFLLIEVEWRGRKRTQKKSEKKRRKWKQTFRFQHSWVLSETMVFSRNISFFRIHEFIIFEQWTKEIWVR